MSFLPTCTRCECEVLNKTIICDAAELGHHRGIIRLL
jgi:hypothetical protein